MSCRLRQIAPSRIGEYHLASPRRAMRLRVLAFAVALVVMACMSTNSMQAFADEVELNVDENLVNPQQLPDSSFIYDTSIEDLSAADAYYDNQTVQVTGEAVGDAIHATFDQKFSWITLSNANNSATIAVFMTREAAARIDTFGRYQARGTILQVRGTFNLACPEHEGVSDLHADVVTVVDQGEHTEEPFDMNKFVPGIVVVVLGLVVTVLFYVIRERQR
ncbi:hydrolase [Eggerthellaceae bacterium 3-80]|nr:hydrolase [bacterium D16-34]